MNTYQQLAHRTCPAPAQHRPDLLPEIHFKDRMEMAREACVNLDPYKKAFAYGKPTVYGDTHQPVPSMDDKTTMLLHMILGIATEAGELLEAIMPVVFDGKPLDEVNLQEELGDVAWYRANALLFLGQTVEENDAQNIAKLKKRFPDRYDADAALNRDIDAERRVLEGHEPDGKDGVGTHLPDPDPDYERVKAENRRTINDPLFDMAERLEFDKTTRRVHEEIRIFNPVIFAYGPEHDRIRGKDVMGDSVITGRVQLQPFLAGDEYGGKYRGMLLATDECHAYRLVGAVRDERQEEAGS